MWRHFPLQLLTDILLAIFVALLVQPNKISSKTGSLPNVSGQTGQPSHKYFKKYFKQNFTNILQIFRKYFRNITGRTAPLPNISSRGGRSFHKTRRTSWSRTCDLIMNCNNIIIKWIFEWSRTYNWTINDKWKIQWRLKYYTVSADHKKVTR